MPRCPHRASGRRCLLVAWDSATRPPTDGENNVTSAAVAWNATLESLSTCAKESSDSAGRRCVGFVREGLPRSGAKPMARWISAVVRALAGAPCCEVAIEPTAPECGPATNSDPPSRSDSWVACGSLINTGWRMEERQHVCAWYYNLSFPRLPKTCCSDLSEKKKEKEERFISAPLFAFPTPPLFPLIPHPFSFHPSKDLIFSLWRRLDIPSHPKHPRQRGRQPSSLAPTPAGDVRNIAYHLCLRRDCIRRKTSRARCGPVAKRHIRRSRCRLPVSHPRVPFA